MSRDPIAGRKRPSTPYPDYLIPEEVKAERLRQSPTPNIRGMDAAAARIVDLFRIDVTRSFIKFHTERSKKLVCHKIGGNRYYSDRDLWDLMHIGTRQTADEQAVGV